MWTLAGLLRGLLNWPVKIFCAYFGHIYVFYDVLLRLYHVRCLNLLKFGHRLNFWDRNKFWCILTDMVFSSSILTIFDRPFYIACDRDPFSARAWFQMFEWGLVYKAYRINHIFYKKFLLNPDRVKIRQILGWQYCPPPWTWR